MKDFFKSTLLAKTDFLQFLPNKDTKEKTFRSNFWYKENNTI